MNQPVIAKEYRGSQVENIHQGVIAIMNDKKELIYTKGDPEQSIYYRSAMKPIQAIPVFQTSVIEKYNLTHQEAALFTASQRGEHYHQEALENLLKKLQLEEEELVCGASYPLNEIPKETYIWNHGSKRRLLHNCAGKHLGMLAYAREKGYHMSGYETPDHPIQKEIKHHVAELSETPEEHIMQGIDGCGLPIYGVPLKNMALSYLKFVVPEWIQDEGKREAVKQIGKVMNASPEIVASHDFICSVLLKDPNIIAKGGAQGVYCLALRREKISIALKVLSGTELLWPALVAKLLEKIDYDNKDTIRRLREISDGSILNDSGKVVGYTDFVL